MYDMRDRESRLAALRRMLGVRAKTKGALDKAIIKFKAENNLGDGADVDFKVFCSMRGAYRKRRLGEGYRPLFFGEQSAEVEELNLMIRRIIPLFTSDLVPPRGSYFGRDTTEGIKYLRRVFMVDGDDRADGELIRRMRTELCAQKFFEE